MSKKAKVLWGKGTYGMMRYMAMVAAGHYKLEWQGDVVDVVAVKQGPYRWVVKVNRTVKFYASTRDEAMDYVANVWGRELVDSVNIMNNTPIKVARSARGGVCDPGSESYWTM
jgi:hypothetical protein